MPQVLIVDDDAHGRAALAELVEAEGYAVLAAADLREARIQLTRERPDLLLIDLLLPDGNGMALVDEVERRNETRIVIMTGHASVDTAIAALRLGAADYLVKPVNTVRLREVLRQARPREAGDALGKGRPVLGDHGCLIGRSRAMQALYRHIERVSPTEATVLLVGESGTGKELVARTVHDQSRRATGPYLAVNCGAISPNLIESEMFGHERGSFTGADRAHSGYFERANGGTLFLDEITEMPAELQVKLLRVLETGRFLPIGTERERSTDVRVLAATNRDPEAAVRSGTLRADLYHRLNVFPLRLPPLREREGDVELLAQRFLDQLNAAHRGSKHWAAGALDALSRYRWPGNVRELRNFVQRAWILGDGELDTGALGISHAAPAAETHTVSIPIGLSLAEVDKRLILATLEKCGGVKKSSADLLGISLKTLYNRLGEYGLRDKRARSDGPDEDIDEADEDSLLNSDPG